MQIQSFCSYFPYSWPLDTNSSRHTSVSPAPRMHWALLNCNAVSQERGNREHSWKAECAVQSESGGIQMHGGKHCKPPVLSLPNALCAWAALWTHPSDRCRQQRVWEDGSLCEFTCHLGDHREQRLWQQGQQKGCRFHWALFLFLSSETGRGSRCVCLLLSRGCMFSLCV